MHEIMLNKLRIYNTNYHRHCKNIYLNQELLSTYLRVIKTCADWSSAQCCSLLTNGRSRSSLHFRLNSVLGANTLLMSSKLPRHIV